MPRTHRIHTNPFGNKSEPGTLDLFVDRVDYNSNDQNFYGITVDQQTGTQVVLHQIPRESVHRIELLLEEPD